MQHHTQVTQIKDWLVTEAKAEQEVGMLCPRVFVLFKVLPFCLEPSGQKQSKMHYTKAPPTFQAVYQAGVKQVVGVCT